MTLTVTVTVTVASAAAPALPRHDAPHDHATYALTTGRRYPQLDATTAVELDQMQCEVCGLTYEVVVSLRPTDPVDWAAATHDPGSFLAFVAFLADRVGACELCCRGTNCRSARRSRPCVCRCHRLDDHSGR